MQNADFIIIGAGMAGASAAYELSALGSVVVLERESQAGYHSTGRSAAIYTQAYGNATIRALTVAGWPFFDDLPSGFSEYPILSPRGVLFIGRQDQRDAIDHAAAEAQRFVASVRRLDAEKTCEMVPILRRDYVGGGVLEPDAMDIDVNALHQGYIRGLRARGSQVLTNTEVHGLARTNGLWQAETPAGTYSAPVVINAAGAWCDQVAAAAGVLPVGLVPKRRTAVIFDPPPELRIDDWPLTIGIDEDFYFKPDAGRILASPADETPVEPCDVQPEELDIAIAVDRIQRVADLEVKRIVQKWAGLRSFVSDKTPVVGFDPEAVGFFWLAGQGGYGIQTAPAMGRLVAALATGRPVPADLAALGVGDSDVSPDRLRTDSNPE